MANFIYSFRIFGSFSAFFQFFIVKRFFSYKKRPINPYLSNRTAAFCVSKKQTVFAPYAKNLFAITFSKNKTYYFLRLLIF